jgi:AcrR family transcriptional regulator
MTRDTLTRDQIIKATIELLDEEGLEGLSMRALGTRLGSAATAVYWHVGNKDNLISLAGDHVWNEITLPDLNVLDWRAAASIMATGLHEMLVRHQWLVRAFGAHMIYGPGKARHDDHCLAIYEAAGFRDGIADQAATSVFIFVLGNALGRTAEASFKHKLSKADAVAQKEMRNRLAKARAVALGFPRLRARIKDVGSSYASAPPRSFEFGLNAMLDGIEAQMTRRGVTHD